VGHGRVSVTDDETELALSRARIVLAAAGVALVAGALLPWAELSAAGRGSFTLNGLDRGNVGWAVLVAGVLVLLVAGFGATRVTAILVGIVGGGVLVLAVRDWADLRRIVEHAEDTLPAPVDGSVALGLWLTVLASLVVVSTAGWIVWAAPGGRRRSRSRTR
jgi:uncharacterized membrane protein YidH (DUF202 family)